MGDSNIVGETRLYEMRRQVAAAAPVGEHALGEAIRGHACMLDDENLSLLVGCILQDGTDIERAVVGELCDDRAGRINNVRHGRTSRHDRIVSAYAVSSGGDFWSRDRGE